MGYMRHHAIVVSGWNEKDVIRAIDYAKGIGLEVIGPSGIAINGIKSFMVCPDGSKEGWETSNIGDMLRTVFVSWLRDVARQGAYFSWAEVQFGDDDGDDKLTRWSGMD